MQGTEEDLLSRIFRIGTLLTLLAALVVAVGCGGDDGGGESSETLSVEEYGQEVTSILEPVGTNLQTIGADISASGSPEELAETVGTAEEEIQGAVDDLAALSPPEEVAEANDQLIQTFEDFNSNLTAVREAAEAEDQQAILDAAGEFPTALQDFQTSLEDVRMQLEDAGVQLGSGG